MTWNPDGACRVLVSFDASSGTPTISSAFNCTLTDDGVGLFTMNFAVSLAADYVVVGVGRHNSGAAAATGIATLRRQATRAEAAGTCKIAMVYEGTPAFEDMPENALWVTGSDA